MEVAASTSSAAPSEVASSTALLSSLPARALVTPSRRLQRGANKKFADRNDDGPRKQKLQLEREELSRIEENCVEKVPSSLALADFLYNCLKCKKTFTTKIRCLAHARNCGKPNSAKKRKKSQRKKKCNICGHIAFTRAELSCHRQSEHKALLKKHRCTRCHKPFSSMKSYWRHVRRHSSTITFKCTTLGCGKIFATRANMIRHQKQHLPEAPTASTQAITSLPVQPFSSFTSSPFYSSTLSSISFSSPIPRSGFASTSIDEGDQGPDQPFVSTSFSPTAQSSMSSLAISRSGFSSTGDDWGPGFQSPRSTLLNNSSLAPLAISCSGFGDCDTGLLSPSSTPMRDSSLLCSSALESSLPVHLQLRNARIRANLKGYLEILKNQGDSPGQLQRVMDVMSSRLYLPTSTGPSQSPPPSSSINGSSAPLSSSLASVSQEASSAASGDSQSQPTSSESVLMVSVSTQTECKYRCDICCKDNRDNWKLKKHKQDMHQPRREG